MILFPAIDLYEGKAVRLFKGRYDDMTIYSEDPGSIGEDFKACGASHIHIVDLEGAKEGTTPNFDTVCDIKNRSGCFCEIGGGIRSMDVVRKYVSGKAPILYDLYSGTGTIGQVLSPVAEKVYGIELIPEAVRAARENAALNGIENCEFIAGDVLEKLAEIPEKPDYIVLDPPREGINPKALTQIIEYGVGEMVYISCKASSFKRDMAVLREHGFRVKRWCLVDLFPQTMHIETIVLLQKLNS